MANNEIKQKIVLEGEKQYRDAIRDAQRNLKTLRSELKAETAEMGANATAQQKNEARVKSLKKQIQEQEKIVKANKDALEEVKQKYGDNADAVAKYEQKLNDSRTALANMKNELDSVGSSMKTVSSSTETGVIAANSFADSLGKIADVGAGVSSAIEETFKGVVSTITDAISDIWAQLMDTAARANNWTDIATMWNTTPEMIQQWYHAVSAEGKDFSKLSNMVTKIVTGDQQKIAASASVSAAEYADQWQYAMAVMDSLSGMSTDDAIKALKGMGINGAKQEGWIDMLKAWGDIKDNLATFDANNGGLGLTDEELEKANQLAIDVEKLRTSWEALKDHALVSLFGDLALNITGNLQQIVEAFDEYFKATDENGRKEALDKIKQNIIDIFTGITDAIRQGLDALDEVAKEMQNSDDPTEQTIGSILGGIVDALSWFTKEENWQTVVKAFEALIGVWAAGKIVSAVGNLGKFAANIATVAQWLGVSAGGTVASAGSLSTSLGSIITSALGKVTIAASIAAVAVPVVSTLKSLIVDGKWPDWLPDPSKPAAETLAPNASKETQEALQKQLGSSGLPSSGQAKDALHYLLTGETPDKSSKNILDELQQTNVATAGGPSSPRIGFSVTAAQQAAVEAYWDAWRSEDSEQQDSAWEAMEAAFAGSEQTFERVDTWLDKLIEEFMSHEGDSDFDASKWMDIPSKWWNTQGGNSGNTDGLTSTDAQNMTGAVRNMPDAVRRGLTGMRVVMDRTVVGQMVADEVSRQIAGYIM